MREQIKFRGKRIDNGEWEYGQYTEANVCNFDGSNPIKKTYINNGAGATQQEVIPDSVSQFTGLMSSDGGCYLPVQEAYFGDVIGFVNTDGVHFFKEITWDNELQCVCFGNFPYHQLYESGYCQPSKIEFEIMGNTFENPNLINDLTKE